MPTESVIIGQRLWDEITKALSLNMTHRILPVIREAYGKEYPPNTPIQLLSTVHSTYLDNPSQKLSSKLMDISVLVGETDYYHIESQMDNDHHMVIRMIAYDLHFAIQHSTAENAATREITLHFPHSLVIYPQQNSAIPDKLQCRLIFPDGSQHIYQVPTVRIQTYSLEDIGEKHLDFFIPFTLLHFRPRLESETDILPAEELTDFIKRLIVILQAEVEEGILTQLECNDYINLLNKASAHIFHKYPAYHEEVLKVTEPLIKLPSVELRELKEAIEQNKEELVQTKEELSLTKEDLSLTKEDLSLTKEDLSLTKEELVLAKKELSLKNAYIKELEQKLAALQS